MLPPEQRRIGMVFQDYALFPHLTVAGTSPSACAALRAPSARRACASWPSWSASPAELDKYPHELSGGQQQRVALARALAPRPELLLLDEPFSNLDVDLRERLSLEVREIIKARGATAVLVTHDQHEAFAMADEIGVMHDGRIAAMGQRRTTSITARPTASSPTSSARACSCRRRPLNGQQLEIELGVLHGGMPQGRRATLEVLLRPDDVVHDDAAPTQAEVVHKAFRGAEILYTLRLASGRKVLALVPSHHNHALGERIGIRLDVDHVVAFRPEV